MALSTLRLATLADDPALRRLLRENPMPGSISLSYEREPDYFIAARMEGALSQTIVQVDAGSGAFLGMGTRVIREMYLNGQAQEVGYMGHLRADMRRPWGLSLARQLGRAFGKFHELHLADGRVPFYLMSVIADNAPANRLLASGLAGLPRAIPFARMVTHTISPRRLRKAINLPGGWRLERGGPEHAQEICACLQRNGARRQFAPVWTAQNLFSPTLSPHLRPEDFFVAIRDSRVRGCIALWDQTSFKQSIVRGYGGWMAHTRPLINSLAKVIDLPRLPDVNAALHSAYASHLAIDGDDPLVFEALLRAIYNETLERGFNYFMIGLPEADPLRKLLTRAYLHVPYPSQIYLMAWEDGMDAAAKVKPALPGLEVAIL